MLLDLVFYQWGLPSPSNFLIEIKSPVCPRVGETVFFTKENKVYSGEVRKICWMLGDKSNPRAEMYLENVSYKLRFGVL
jgi:hypothetical protein